MRHRRPIFWSEKGLSAGRRAGRTRRLLGQNRACRSHPQEKDCCHHPSFPGSPSSVQHFRLLCVRFSGCATSLRRGITVSTHDTYPTRSAFHAGPSASLGVPVPHKLDISDARPVYTRRCFRKERPEPQRIGPPRAPVESPDPWSGRLFSRMVGGGPGVAAAFVHRRRRRRDTHGYARRRHGNRLRQNSCGSFRIWA